MPVDVSGLLQILRDYGFPLVVVVMLITEVIVPGAVYKRVREERDRAYDRIDRFIDVVEAATGVKAPPKAPK